MSESETESVEPVEVEVETPPKKTRRPMSDERRKQMLLNLAKGRKTRNENLTKNRLDKEEEQKQKEKEHKCEFCGSHFKYKASCTKHKKICPSNPANEGQEPPQTFPVKAEVEKKPLEPPPEPPKEEKKEKKKKKKVVYVDSDSSSDEEVIYKKKKTKKNIVYVNNPAPAPAPPPAVPTRPQLTEEQKKMILKKRQEEARYAQMGREHEANANRIKMMSANMLRKNRF
tara:strand:- start:124 stop:807 length:684 start_codon:yes stop_codon:yes gene_type:complete